jgi:hypothetical protein
MWLMNRAYKQRVLATAVIAPLGFLCDVRRSEVRLSCELSSYFTENLLCLHYRNQSVNSVQIIIANFFYLCTVHFDIYKVHTPTYAFFIKLDKVLKFTLKITLTCSYMFRSATIIRKSSLEPSYVFRLKFSKSYVVKCYAMVWQHAA